MFSKIDINLYGAATIFTQMQKLTMQKHFLIFYKHKWILNKSEIIYNTVFVINAEFVTSKEDIIENLNYMYIKFVNLKEMEQIKLQEKNPIFWYLKYS